MSSPVILTAEELRRVNYPDKCTELVRGHTSDFLLPTWEEGRKGGS